MRVLLADGLMKTLFALFVVLSVAGVAGVLTANGANSCWRRSLLPSSGDVLVMLSHLVVAPR